ncbi:hypothetical protein [Streptomyces sp. NPDC037389]|uniref:hypothetical protein n=1 Tax=Streptomyces sp. NPDC037389 TaxID=3155369 RepID=UPI0033C87E64
MRERAAHFANELNKLSTYLSYEMAAETGGYLRPTLHSFNDAYVEAVQSGLKSILDDRNLTVNDYMAIRDIKFEGEGALYDYLGKIYDYLFGDLAEQSLPPD